MRGLVSATRAASGGLQILVLRSLSHNGASSMHKWLRGLRDVGTCILFDVSFGLDAFRPERARQIKLNEDRNG